MRWPWRKGNERRSSAGGALALCAAADDDRIRGVATLAAPAEFDAWASDARAFLSHCRRVGVIREAGFHRGRHA